MATRKDEKGIAAGMERKMAAILDVEISNQVPDLAASSQSNPLKCYR